MLTMNDNSLRIEGHGIGGGYDVYIDGKFIGDADTLKEAIALSERYKAERQKEEKRNENNP